MSNDNSVQPEQSVPDPVQWAVNIHRVEALRVAKIDRDIQTMDTRIAETKALLAELEDNHEGALRALAIASKNAAVALEMAERICKDYGWTLPEPKGEPPLNETSRFPAVPPLDAAQVVPAVPWMGVQLRQVVTVYRTDGRSFRGEVTHMSPELLVLGIGGDPDVSEFAPGEVDRVETSNKLDPNALRDRLRPVEPAEVSDQTTATPAASVTVPDEAAQS